MVTWLLNKFGLTTINESESKIVKLQNIISTVEEDKERLEEFFSAVYSYHGNYPNWKAQQEFRHLVSKDAAHHADAIDDYLTVVIDATRECMVKRGLVLDYFWKTTEKLADARGHRGWKPFYPVSESENT
jgi:hypothetical protein